MLKWLKKTTKPDDILAFGTILLSLYGKDFFTWLQNIIGRCNTTLFGVGCLTILFYIVHSKPS